MKRIGWLWLLIFPALLLAQEEEDSTSVEMIRLAGDFGIGQELNFGKASVNFLGVISDSRCPTQVTCIWPGEAKVLLGVRLNGKYFEKEVVVAGRGAEIPLPNDILMQFSHLRPYPETGAKIPAEDYCLRISALFPENN